MYILLVQDGDIKKHTSRRKDRADQPRDIMFQRKAFPFYFIAMPIMKLQYPREQSSRNSACPFQPASALLR
jgi:hypothetical protein